MPRGHPTATDSWKPCGDSGWCPPRLREPRSDTTECAHPACEQQDQASESTISVIDGIAYVREPPAPSRLHQEVVGELYRQIANSLQGKRARVYAAPLDVRLPKYGGADDQNDTVIQPDVIIVSELHKLDDRGMRGAPEWVAEVLSPSTAIYDRTTKLRAFERAGVPEVWLIDPTDRTVTIYRIAAGQYEPPAVSIDWDHVLAM